MAEHNCHMKMHYSQAPSGQGGWTYKILLCLEPQAGYRTREALFSASQEASNDYSAVIRAFQHHPNCSAVHLAPKTELDFDPQANPDAAENGVRLQNGEDTNSIINSFG